MNAAMKPVDDSNCTWTSEGRIAHLEVFCDLGILHAPVKIDWLKSNIYYSVQHSHERPVPLRREGRLVYALPGGGEFIP